MTENTTVVTMKWVASIDANWTIRNWKMCHKVAVAAEASCLVEVGNPKVGLRFFLRPKERLSTVVSGHYPVLSKWYSLCAEVLTQVNQNAAIEVNATVYGDKLSLVGKGGTIPLYMSKGKVLEVIDPFIYFESCSLNDNGQENAPNHTGLTHGHSVQDVRIAITAKLFRLTDNGKNVAPVDTDVKESTEAVEPLINDLKNMFVAHENYADLKLESKDHMTVDAHKFILAARSRYLQKCIEDAMKVENFNGTMKMNVNGKALVVILLWIYTGELHENSGNVMEEVVDAAILFELTHLMKLLDGKLITICNKENMFRLYQVAQKNGMPNAMDNISVYIRENL